VLGAALGLTCTSARAVDPMLHSLPPEYFEIQVPLNDPNAAEPTLGAQAESAEDIDVREVRDLGARRHADAEDATSDDLWDRMRRGFAIPDLDGPLVVERQAWYAERPEQMRIMVERSRRYLYHIVEELEKRGMPTELALLPMVESAFNPMANSSARASGLWQFIPSTGKNYNLEQNWWYDGRRDIVASTSAALDYLEFLYELHGDWHLALASYNMGENGVLRAMARNRAQGKPTDYEHLPMPKETRYYVPKLQALKNIIAHPDLFGIDLAPIPNAPYFVTVDLTRDIDLNVAAKLAEMPVSELIALNPGHNRPVVSSAVSPQLVLPTDRADVFIRNLATHKKPLSSWQSYVYKRGDSLTKIAKAHGITVAKVRELNNLGPRARLRVGQRLLLPRKERVETAIVPPGLPKPAPTRQAAATHYVVKRGDTLTEIARQFNLAVADLKRWNGGKSAIRVGQRISLVAPPARTAKSKGSAKSRSQVARGF
jgi:membrane-bound lytic murein transglycosylase D